MKLLERLRALWADLWQSPEYELECVGHMQKVVFNDGDVIVITVDEWLPASARAGMEGYVRTRMGNVKVLILENGAKLSVLGMPHVAEVDRGAD